MELKIGQLVKYDINSELIGMILFVSFDNHLKRQRCIVLWNDGVITNGWMNLISIL